MTEPKDVAIGKVGEAADTVDSLLAALSLPLPAQLHIEGLRGSLPKLRDDLRAAYVALYGDDPWS